MSADPPIATEKRTSPNVAHGPEEDTSTHPPIRNLNRDGFEDEDSRTCRYYPAQPEARASEQIAKCGLRALSASSIDQHQQIQHRDESLVLLVSQKHLDDEQPTMLRNRLSADAKNIGSAVVIPIVQNLLEKVDVPSGRN